jgi:hypothetical protein
MKTVSSDGRLCHCWQATWQARHPMHFDVSIINLFPII